MSPRSRPRPATLEIAGRIERILAPGLKAIRRAGRVDLYWVADEDAVKRGYPTKTRRIHVDLSAAEASRAIREICASEQAAMLAWLDDPAALERPKLRFDGTLGSLVDLYESDADSAFQDLKLNTAASYRDSLKIIRATVGERRVDRVVPKDFRRWHKNWRKPESEGGEPRLRRAYGCVQMLRVVLLYGMEAGLSACAPLRQALDHMRFERNAPRDKILSFEQARAIVRKAIARGERGVAVAQALQYECVLRQSDVIGQWRRLASGKPAPGEIAYGGLAWRGLTWDQVSVDADLVVRTSKTGQPAVHDLAACPLVVEALAAFPERPSGGPVVTRADGRPFLDRRSFGRRWREIATAAGIPADVHNRDSRAGGISEAAEAGARDDDLARMAAHADKSITRRVYKRLGRESAHRVQEKRLGHRARGDRPPD